MKIVTCFCIQCRYRLNRQKKHGEDIITHETRSARRIVNQILKTVKNNPEIEIEIPEKRAVPRTA